HRSMVGLVSTISFRRRRGRSLDSRQSLHSLTTSAPAIRQYGADNTTTFVHGGSLRFTVTMISKIRPLSTLLGGIHSVERTLRTNRRVVVTERTGVDNFFHTSRQVPELPTTSALT